jgi:hypothetical protein
MLRLQIIGGELYVMLFVTGVWVLELGVPVAIALLNHTPMLLN